jgi:hypothetical protein
MFSFSIFSGDQVSAWQHRGTIVVPKLVSSVIQRFKIPSKDSLTHALSQFDSSTPVYAEKTMHL